MFASIVLHTTDRCPVECDLCGLFCSPRGTHTMTFALMKNVIDTVVEKVEVTHVTFTGGEPFLLKEDLEKGIKQARSHGMTTRIVTNAYWATTVKKSVKILKKMKAAGLTEINISVDDMHQQHIPLQQVKNAHDACIELDLRVLLAHKALSDSTITIPYLADFFDHELFELEEERKKVMTLRVNKQSARIPSAYVYSTSGCVPVGQNSDKVSNEQLSYRRSPIRQFSRCDNILKDIIIGPQGELEVCCGVVNNSIPELSFGNIEKDGLFETIQTANNDLIVNWLALEGPYGIRRYIEEKRPNHMFRDPYSGICHLCYDIFTNKECRGVLAGVNQEKVQELIFKRDAFHFLRDDREFTDSFFQRPFSNEDTTW